MITGSGSQVYLTSAHLAMLASSVAKAAYGPDWTPRIRAPGIDEIAVHYATMLLCMLVRLTAFSETAYTSKVSNASGVVRQGAIA